MPEQIETPAPDQVPSREPHDLAHSFAMPGFVAMYRTMFARRFLRKRTAPTTFEGVSQEISAIATDRVFVQRQVPQFTILHAQNRDRTGMMSSAVDRGEQPKDFQILDFLTRQVESGFIFHGFILQPPPVASLDGHQET
jgi:hypothetical protein